MTASIISIGDELLIGQVVNTNASWLGSQLTGLGLNVLAISTIGDGKEAIIAEIRRLAAASDLLVISGGLGPTHDDMTKPAICDLLGCDMEMNDEQLARIGARFAERNIPMNDRSRDQALVPSACRVLPNDYGSAPGLAFRIGGTTAYILPGVPGEMRGIFSDRIAPELQGAVGEIERATFLLVGVPESQLADELHDVYPLLDENVTLAFLPSSGMIRLRAMMRGTGKDITYRYDRLIEGIRRGGARWLVADRDIGLAEVVGDLLRERGATLATAESCTGGMIGEKLTEIPGSSDYYLGGVVAYANTVKSVMLGVPESLIREHGAISQEVAESMAEGARRALGSDFGVAVTGIAGPGGGSQEKPVGTVWVAVATSTGTTSRRHQLGNERGVVRERSTNIALEMVRRALLEGE